MQHIYHLLQPVYHKDPFDNARLAGNKKCLYINSADENVKKYTAEGLKIFTGK